MTFCFFIVGLNQDKRLHLYFSNGYTVMLRSALFLELSSTPWKYLNQTPPLTCHNHSPSVEFCGYSIPHPSEAKMNVRIQTYGQFSRSLNSLGVWSTRRSVSSFHPFALERI